jgi:hypothetical protein
MVNLNEAPATAVARAKVQAPAWVAFSPVIVGGPVVRAEHPHVMPSCAGFNGAGVADSGPSFIGGEGRSLPRTNPTAYLFQHIEGQLSTRKTYPNTTRIAALGGGAKGPHPLREPEPV